MSKATVQMIIKSLLTL